jgi:hypothetical protein
MVDNESADRMLKYFRERVAHHDDPDGDDEDDGWEHVAEFCYAHHQSLGWLITGDVDCLLGWAASSCPAAFEDYTG